MIKYFFHFFKRMSGSPEIATPTRVVPAKFRIKKPLIHSYRSKGTTK